MVSVALDGRTIDDTVLCDGITVRVGRRSTLDQGEPGYASLTMWLDTWDPGIQPGGEITITDEGSIRFIGSISDVSRTFWEEIPDDPRQYMVGVRILCTGPLARWGRDIIGDEPWPAETVAERAARVSALVGQPLIVEGGDDVRVVARDVDRQPAIDIIEDLATDASGWLYDFAGETILQDIRIRRLGDPQETWDNQTSTWDLTDGTWDEQTGGNPDLPSTIALPPDAVLFAPPWAQSSVLANHATVLYGIQPEDAEQASIVMEDAASIARYGRNAIRVLTRLEDAGEATLRASLVLERGAQPRWTLPDVDVAWEELDEQTATALRLMRPGHKVDVTALPMPGPATSFMGSVEGWEETWNRADGMDTAEVHTLTLFLSDLRHSFAVLTWDGIVPDTLAWAQLADVAWDDLLTADDLTEVAA